MSVLERLVRSLSELIGFRADFEVVSGGRRIRTFGRSFSPYNGLANRRLQPLGHASVLSAHCLCRDCYCQDIAQSFLSLPERARRLLSIIRLSFRVLLSISFLRDCRMPSSSQAANCVLSASISFCNSTSTGAQPALL